MANQDNKQGQGQAAANKTADQNKDHKDHPKTGKVKLPHAGKAPRVAGSNKPDWDKTRPIVMEAINQIDGGHLDLIDIGEVDPTNNTHADEQALISALHRVTGSGVKSGQRLRWFIVEDTNPSDPGVEAPQA